MKWLARVFERWWLKKDHALLALMSRHGGLTGREMVRLMDGAVGKGSIYVRLDQMETRGWVVSTRLSGGRRTYRITSAGRDALAERA